MSASRILSRRPRLRQIDRLLTISECERLRRLAGGALGAVEAHAFPDQVERSSTGCWLPRGDSPPSAWRTLGAGDADIALVRRLELLLAAECKLHTSHGEPMQILRYREGQRYDVHPDFFDPFDGASLANGGQRLLSCLVYLSTVPPHCGGATYFPEASPRGLRVQPEAGRAIVLNNCLEGGKPDPRSVHAGEVVKRGAEKWVLTKWVRRRPFRVATEGFG